MSKKKQKNPPHNFEKQKTVDYNIVAIGASAGGLEALESFFKTAPADQSISYFVIQHKDPNSKSEMAPLLSRHTKMPVKEIEENMRIEPNTVYTNPPGKNASLFGNVCLLENIKKESINLPIDLFFRSVGKEFPRSVGIILSGTGSDGSLGIKEIKSGGGMVLVQEPEQAKFDGMPISAINTGLADEICPVAEMAEKILGFLKHPYITIKGDTDIEEKIVNSLPKIYRIIESVTDHDFRDYKESTIIRRIERRMAINHIKQIDEYLKVLEDDEEETEKLFKEMLISVTNFFREPNSFKYLKEKVLLPYIKNKEERFSLRVWVPGCATGEEAYSIAILIDEIMGQTKKRGQVQIFATDVDEASIESSRKGIFNKNIAVDISQKRLDEYFTKVDDSYKINKDIRGMIIFAQHDIIKDPPFNAIDLISCRNVLIYFNQDLQKNILRSFFNSLKDEGYLFLGYSESIDPAFTFFENVDKKNKIFKCNKEYDAKAHFAYQPGKLNTTLTAGKMNSENRSINEKVENLIIKKYSLPAVLINRQNEVLYFYGDTSDYLTFNSGAASLNVIQMCRLDIQITLGNMIFSAKEKEGVVVKEDAMILKNNEEIIFDIIIRPVVNEGGKRRNYLIVFKEKYRIKYNKTAVGNGDDAQKDSLTKELETMKAHLQSTIEELQYANGELQMTNEELQARNEELQSSNEELETSKEEVKSTNEELLTVNSELNTKIKELHSIKNDMNNLLKSTNLATLILDKELKIRNITPQLKELFNILPSDTGRSITDINIKIDYDSILENAKTVLDTLEKKTIEKLDKTGCWYRITILPYRTVDNIIDGVVINFVDITEVKALKRLATVVEDSNDAVTVHNMNGEILEWNKGAEKMYGYSETEAKKMNIDELTPEENRNETKQAIKKLKNGKIVNPFYTSRIAKNGKKIEVLLKMTRLSDKEGFINEIATTEKTAAKESQIEKENRERLKQLEQRINHLNKNK